MHIPFDQSLKLFFEMSGDLFCIACDGHFKELNPAWSKTLGWTLEELKSRPYIDFIHPLDRGSDPNAKCYAHSSSGGHRFENRYLTRSGEYRWLQWNTTVVDHGTIGVARDITEQKKQEQLLLRSQERTRFFQQLVESTNDPTYLISPKDGFRFVYVNRACCRHFGREESELLAMSIPDWDPNFSPGDLDQLWQDMRKEKKRTIETAHKVNRRGVIPVEVTINYVTFKGEEYLGGYIRDISERKRLEENLSHFVYAVSHDLQEPLRTINSYLQLVERKAPPSPELIEYIGFASDAATRMRERVRALLEYSQLSKSPRQYQAVNLNEIVDHTVMNLRQKIQESGAIISRSALPTIEGDAVLLGQVFQNLIDNAIKYRGELPPQIQIAVQPGEGEWEIIVEDHGIGIPEADRERVFRIFQRLHGHHEVPGIGIGLATCQKVIEMHGGRIWIEPGQHRGSRFHFTLSDGRMVTAPKAKIISEVV